MNGPLMAVLRRTIEHRVPITIADLIDRPITSVNTSWEKFQVNIQCFKRLATSNSEIISNKHPTESCIYNFNTVFMQLSISEKGLYEEDSKDVATVLNNMATLPFVEIEQKDGGTQFKLTVEFPEGAQALLKPMRHPRTQVTLIFSTTSSS